MTTKEKLEKVHKLHKLHYSYSQILESLEDNRNRVSIRVTQFDSSSKPTINLNEEDSDLLMDIKLWYTQKLRDVEQELNELIK